MNNLIDFSKEIVKLLIFCNLIMVQLRIFSALALFQSFCQWEFGYKYKCRFSLDNFPSFLKLSGGFKFRIWL